MVSYIVVDLYLYDSFSLKDKRAIKRSMFDRVRSKYNVSIAEVGHLDQINHLNLAVAIASNNYHYSDQVLDKIITFIESNYAVEILDIIREKA